MQGGLTTASPTTSAPCSASLERFSQNLRPYQESTVNHAFEFAQAPDVLKRRLYASPAGSGKGSIQLALLRRLREAGANAWILTPSLEVLRGFLERCGAGDLSTVNAGKLAELGETIRVSTPTRFRNRIFDGDYLAPEVVLYDEVHHAIEGNEVSGALFAVAPSAVWIGFTATPYRATPKSTLALREAWGEPWVVLTIPEAIEAGYQSLPRFSVVPLVDDDQIKVSNGKFVTKDAAKHFGSRVEALAQLVAQQLQRDGGPLADTDPLGCPVGLGVPTAITVPSTESARLLVDEFQRVGIEARFVGQETKARDRQAAYDACREGRAVLVSIMVLTEGVDLPWLRRLVDARPTMSPVAWVQQIGRIMRPGPTRPEYICVCRNLERHAWLMQGAVPAAKVAEAQQAFGEPSARAGHRSIGFEKLARFKVIRVPLAGGLTAGAYALFSTDSDGVITEWFTLLSPTSAQTLCATRTIRPRLEGEETRPASAYGKWVQSELPATLSGFAKTSRFNGSLSDKQRAWWERSAERYGLDKLAAETISQRAFAVLPVLSDLRLNALDWDKQ